MKVSTEVISDAERIEALESELAGKDFACQQHMQTCALQAKIIERMTGQAGEGAVTDKARYMWTSLFSNAETGIKFALAADLCGDVHTMAVELLGTDELDPAKVYEVAILKKADYAGLLAALAQSRAAIPAEGARYTCIGKGGDYELIGQATGAGTRNMDNGLAVYRCLASGLLFFREQEDFDKRMEPAPTVSVRMATAFRDATTPPSADSVTLLPRFTGRIESPLHNPYVEMQPDGCGDFVRYEDVAALFATERAAIQPPSADSVNWNHVIDQVADSLEEHENLSLISQFTALCEEFDKRGAAATSVTSHKKGGNMNFGQDDNGKPVLNRAAPTVTGMVVSMDVSTCDDDATNRIFGRVEGLQNDTDGKLMILAAEESRNFTAPTVDAVSARNQALSDAIAVCNSERVEDTGTDSDAGYNAAIEHCVEGIMGLMRNPPAPVPAGEFPPLPEATARLYEQNGYRRASVLPGPGAPLFAADQLHAYVLADRASRGKASDAEGAARYEFVRKLSPHQFADLWRDNIAGEGAFDDLVDAARAQQQVVE